MTLRAPFGLPIPQVARSSRLPGDPQPALDDQARALRVLAALPARHRAVLLLHDRDGLPTSVIAYRHGIDQREAVRWVYEAREAFRREWSCRYAVAAAPAHEDGQPPRPLPNTATHQE